MNELFFYGHNQQRGFLVKYLSGYHFETALSKKIMMGIATSIPSHFIFLESKAADTEFLPMLPDSNAQIFVIKILISAGSSAGSFAASKFCLVILQPGKAFSNVCALVDQSVLPLLNVAGKCGQLSKHEPRQILLKFRTISNISEKQRFLNLVFFCKIQLLVKISYLQCYLSETLKNFFLLKIRFRC